MLHKDDYVKLIENHYKKCFNRDYYYHNEKAGFAQKVEVHKQRIIFCKDILSLLK